MTKLFVYYCDNFEGHYPVGTAALVVAENAGKAESLLKQELQRIGLGKGNTGVTLTMTQVNTDIPAVVIINDGNY